MSFDYNKTSRSHGNSDSFWTSYSDLFLGLSTIFLLLYVTASLRTGTDAIKAQVDNRKLSMEVDELKSQLKMYEAVKTNYLENKASQTELQEYQELMDKLTLLQEDAKDDSEKLAMKALENERKAVALNKYQQMVRNVINANKVAKTKLIARNDLIADQDTTIDEQKKDINTLESDVQQKKQMIEQNQKQISHARAALAKHKKDLLAAYQANQMTKQAYEQKTRQIQAQGEEKIKSLVATNQEYSSQLNQLSSELKGTQSALQGTQTALNQKAQEAHELQGKLHASAGEAQGLKSKIAALRAAHDKEIADARGAFDAEVRKGQMDAAERSRREGELRANAAAKERELAGRIGALQGQLKDTTGELAKAKEEMDARRGIAREIQKGFGAAGIKADVDMRTGEVVLDFGDHYFESDSANLKDEMKDIIERAMPVYSRSLFGNPKIASKISTVEIVGYASPTYKGKYVDPRSDKPEDKAALKYNMDLSYRRANSIFNYLVENKGPHFQHQKNLLALMKVSGRSFLEVMKVQSRAPASAGDFCKQNDCKKAQRVIVRFSMDGKK